MQFSRPVGARIDQKELEYIAALHQTCLPCNRSNGTVGSKDIVRFFVSRCGFKVTHEDALRLVRGLGGGRIATDVLLRLADQREEELKPSNRVSALLASFAKKKENQLLMEEATGTVGGEYDEKDEPEEYLDLVQLTAILLMPTLSRAGADYLEPNPPIEEKGPEPSQENWFQKLLHARQRMGEEWLQQEKEELRPKLDLKAVLHILLANIDLDAEIFPTLDEQLVKKLLEAHGEVERAHDDKLVAQMVEVCRSKSGTLDVASWIHALTGDMTLWEPGCEDRNTTYVYDVWGFDNIKDKEEHDARNLVSQENYSIDRSRNQPSIDSVVDGHSSLAVVVGIWLFYIVTSVMFTTLLTSLPGLGSLCGNKSFGCKLVETIYVWMMFAVILTVLGFVIIIPLSLANNPVERDPWRNFCTVGAALFYTWFPFAIVQYYERNDVAPPYEGAETIVTKRSWEYSQAFAQAIGCWLIIMAIKEYIASILGSTRIKGYKKMQAFFTTSNQRGVVHQKKAATRKLNMMLEHAFALHPESGVEVIEAHPAGSKAKRSDNDQTLLNFVFMGERLEECGSFFWTWKQILSGRLFHTEGIWIMTRLCVFQAAQILFIVFYLLTLAAVIESVADEADRANAEMQEGLPQWVYDLVPTGAQTRGALYPAYGVSVLIIIVTFLIYMPSYVGIVLRYRCGLMPSLGSASFTKYRNNVDAIYTNIGNAIYAMIGSASLFFLLTALAIFLFIWPFTQDFMFLVMAWGIGLTITIVVKVLITKSCSKRFYSSFYRTQPAHANLSTLALECWFIGLGGGVLVGRFTQFVLAACFWVGRTDVPFLSEDVNIAGYAFDYVPINFVKELLCHEAHRHPYMERLMTMYMMKLKNDSFGSEANACWRQLLVGALMPWLLKNRVFSEERLSGPLDLHQRG